MADTITQILGNVTAYADAVAAGYTGTREQFATDQANFAANATEVANNLGQSRQVLEDVNAAGTTQTNRVITEGNTQVERVTNTGTTEVGKVGTAGTTQVNSINDAGSTQVTNVNNAGDTKVSAVDTAGTTQVNAVNTAGTNKLNEINSAGAVLYSAQTLTDEQKTQSRTNIDALEAAHKDSLSAHPWLFRGKTDLITKSVSGDSLITADDSAGGWVKGPTVYGKSVQNGTPTPDAPVAVNGVSGELVACGKNLIPPFISSISKDNVGVVMSVEKDGQYISCNGTYTGSSSSGRVVFKNSARGFLLRAGRTYQFSAFLQSGSYTGTVTIIISNKDGETNAPFYSTTIGVPLRITPQNDITLYVGVHCGAGSTYTNAVFVFQIEEGSVATPYSPYIGATYTSPDLQGIPLGATIPEAVSSNPALMSGVYHDGTQYWCGDTWEPTVLVDGAWRSRATLRMVKKVFDGTETMTIDISSVYAYFTTSDIALMTSTAVIIPALCTHFMPTSTQLLTADGYNMHFAGSTVNPQLRFRYDGYSNDSTAFKSWLAARYAAGTPVTVWYLTNAPVETLSDPVYIDAPKGTLNLYHTSAVQPHITADYPLDIKAYVDKQVSTLTAAIAELSAT